MQISLTKLRNEMFKLLPRLRDDEELTVTFEGKAAYTIRKASHDRNTRFLQSLSKCPKLSLSDEEVISFKNEGRK
jgi:antitoxin (DNA-binding transcriptional repressor) of toxin-antitoxin stability system